MELFEQNAPPAPLADRMRPSTLDTLVGQEEVIGEDKPLGRILRRGKIPPSMIFWGPPGCGKTTIARIVAETGNFHFTEFSAVTSGVKDVKRVVEEAKLRRKTEGRGTILFVDEIHRFNRSQQDAFLPHIEAGVFILIGATTENPSFEINSALLSRCRVFTLKALTDENIRAIVNHALEDGDANFEPEAVSAIADIANGDARVALNLVELASASEDKVTAEVIRDAAQRQVVYDKDREEHYNSISAFIKSMRGSDPDAALYWLARMIEGGEEPLFIARRLVIFASEDIGNADPRALQLAVACQQAVDFVGLPEGFHALAQTTTYLATAPKSNASYAAYTKALRDVKETRNDPVPLHLRNAVTGFMKGLDYGKGYQYAHDYEDAVVDQEFRPENVARNRYYQPTERGYEATIGKLMKMREERRRKK
jgi:putative ATPase